MYGNLAKLRIDDMIRDADAYRRSRNSRAARAGEARGNLRRVLRSAVSLLLWPVKH